MQDSIGVDTESRLNLGASLRSWRNTGKHELAKQLVIRSHLSLSLQNFDRNAGLCVLNSREDVGFGDRNGRVSGDHLEGKPAFDFCGESERRDIEQNQVLEIAFQDTALNGCAHCDCLIRVD